MFNVQQRDGNLEAMRFSNLKTPPEIRACYRELSALGAPAELRDELAALASAPSCDPGELLACLKKVPALAFLFSRDSRIMEGYTIEEHTSMVLRQFERYFHQAPIPVSKSGMRIALALHDIGKPLPDEKRDQHSATEEVINSFRDILPVDDGEFARILSVVRNDVIGRVVVAGLAKQASLEERRAIAVKAQSTSLTEDELKTFARLVQLKTPEMLRDEIASSVESIRVRAPHLGLSPRELLEFQVLFYAVDTSAYTYDAVASNGRRASPGLEFLFEMANQFSVTEGARMLKGSNSGIRFSSSVNAIISALADSL